MQTPSRFWFGRRPVLMLGLVVAAFALVACDGDDNGDDLGLDGNGTTNGTTNGGNGGTDATATPGTGGGNGAGGQLQIEMIDIDYSQDQIQATAGEEVTIDFENTGALEHTFTITEIDADGVSDDFQTDEYDIDVHLNAGESATLSFTPNEAGSFEFWCTIPGHREAGMVGTLTVQ